MQKHVVRCGILGYPCPGLGGPYHLPSQPPPSEIDEMHPAIDDRSSFKHPPYPRWRFDPDPVHLLIAAMQVPDVDQPQTADVSHHALTDPVLDLLRNWTEAVHETH